MTYPTTEQATELAADLRLPTFVYGTLRPECGNDLLWLGRANVLCDATAGGYMLVGQGFPYMIPLRDGHVRGTLIAPHADDYAEVMADMDALEGVAYDHYRRITIPVELDEGGTICSWVYIPVQDHSTRQAVRTNEYNEYDWTAS